MLNTGDSSGDGKSSGEGVRGKRLTKARCSRGESDGAEESEHGKAVYTRMRTDGEGPSPLGRWEQRSPANARAVHGEGTVELEQCERTLHGFPWRRTKGAEPDAVKAASPVLNGEDEETGRKVLRLVLTQLLRSGYCQRLTRGVRPFTYVQTIAKSRVTSEDR